MVAHVPGVVSIPIRTTALQTERGINPTPFDPTLSIQKPKYVSPSATTTTPPGEITEVLHDSTMTGDGVSTPLSVVKIATPRNIAITAVAGGVKIAQTPAAFDGSANVAISNFDIIGLDGGSY
jgi:hypothetical protein